MTINIDFWQIVGFLLSFLGCCFGFGKLLLAQYSHKLNAQFKYSDERLSILIETQKESSTKVSQLERDLLLLKADLPLAYVRRDDFVRSQTVIESKIDAVALKIEQIQLGARNV